MTQLIREAVGVFDDLSNMDKAIAELEGTAFPRHDISVLGDKDKLKERFGSRYVDTAWVEDNPYAPRKAPVRPEERTIGATLLIALPAYLFGCAGLLMVNPASSLVMLSAVALGSIVGAALGAVGVMFLRARMEKAVDAQVRSGGLVLWVRTPGPKREEKAKNIMSKHGARHVHAHNIT